ncbi:MAG: hypothetical protein A3C80_02620 [Candidatus Ryanbacteria bacterium RIFCSPHIGHO2_02_FULL_45_43]|nr:MAG: hypothetical protein A2718_01035 [Candidatus Ryanbacteria bacterium RIFCSPHIGHO2_01_FULL_44_130]OGZ47837.1 MAG: hypothetical protein A3C80_02620 [Candidatus Ryanbacteria bacterium RIFCSPHIGHO2_02_FULL_45_43]
MPALHFLNSDNVSFGVFIQLRSYLLYQKFLKKRSAAALRRLRLSKIFFSNFRISRAPKKPNKEEENFAFGVLP